MIKYYISYSTNKRIDRRNYEAGRGPIRSIEKEFKLPLVTRQDINKVLGEIRKEDSEAHLIVGIFKLVGEST